MNVCMNAASCLMLSAVLVTRAESCICRVRAAGKTLCAAPPKAAIAGSLLSPPVGFEAVSIRTSQGGCCGGMQGWRKSWIRGRGSYQAGSGAS